jgi:hypothetical protein
VANFSSENDAFMDISRLKEVNADALQKEQQFYF